MLYLLAPPPPVIQPCLLSVARAGPGLCSCLEQQWFLYTAACGMTPQSANLDPPSIEVRGTLFAQPGSPGPVCCPTYDPDLHVIFLRDIHVKFLFDHIQSQSTTLFHFAVCAKFVTSLRVKVFVLHILDVFVQPSIEAPLFQSTQRMLPVSLVSGSGFALQRCTGQTVNRCKPRCKLT